MPDHQQGAQHHSEPLSDAQPSVADAGDRHEHRDEHDAERYGRVHHEDEDLVRREHPHETAAMPLALLRERAFGASCCSRGDEGAEPLDVLQELRGQASALPAVLRAGSLRQPLRCADQHRDEEDDDEQDPGDHRIQQDRDDREHENRSRERAQRRAEERCPVTGRALHGSRRQRQKRSGRRSNTHSPIEDGTHDALAQHPLRTILHTRRRHGREPADDRGDHDFRDDPADRCDGAAPGGHRIDGRSHAQENDRERPGLQPGQHDGEGGRPARNGCCDERVLFGGHLRSSLLHGRRDRACRIAEHGVD